ncbi:protein arginine methyltransferase NDUFAF7, mitochondrial isoform X2 [Melanotaenia boesemani]|uniref:protein arginine methyltransferase NDUFAF7, mitochondrial isoform X2 n=1 Tax=Melanotaenia boesemani TaxID=1250792 RepID=UPI001C042631|nr:protein arginine methyltransferase NDUFAF7, mitochondrial isoform X2 [Melanotaenia boesemani]
MRVFLGVKTYQLVSRVFIHPISPPAAVRCGRAASRCVHGSSENGKHPPSMLRHLTSKIKATGPIPVAEYMREVLTNPVTGYYVKKDVLGPDGDFITSPEISQIFGELVGVWIVSEWMGAGRPGTLQLVELGPGKGSLAGDILRVFSQLRSVLGETSVSLHLVEVSPALSLVQAQNLTGTCSREAHREDDPVYRRGTTGMGTPASWYRRLEDVPAGFSIFVAHEFFDALPIHKFQAGERREHVEVCAEGGVIIQQLAQRIVGDGGAALIADYGHDGTKTDTFRGFKEHQLHDVLSSPGSADLTADVDFSYLRWMAGGGVACLGPISQRTFLKNMGIDTRMQVLLRSCSDASSRKQLISSYHRLTDPADMGQRFHFFSLLHPGRLARPQHPEGLKLERKRSPAPLPVAGFSELSFS